MDKNSKEITVNKDAIAEAIYDLSNEIRFLGNGGASRTSTGIGAVEGLAMIIRDSNLEIASSLGEIASAIRELAEAISEKSQQ